MIQSLFQHRLVSVRFIDRIPKSEKISNDLYCSAIARSIKTGKKIVIDCRRHLCAGGNYFVGGIPIGQKDIVDVYVNKEFVFRDKEIACDFIKRAGRNVCVRRYVVFEPFKNRADVIVGIANAEQISRILGLASYSGNFGVDIVPAISTCSSLFRPLLESQKIHINFIDYFDRHLQCPGFFDSNDIIVSMSPQMFRAVRRAYSLSPHGKKMASFADVHPVLGL